MTWDEVYKSSLYTDNILPEYGGLLNKWALQMCTNVQDMRLEFLEKYQTSRFVEEKELLQMLAGHDQPFKPGRLFLTNNFVNSPAY